MLRLDAEVMIAAVVPLNMEVKHSLVVETFAARTHQRWEPEVVHQGVEYQPCHQHEVLVTGLTLLEEINCLHGPVPHILTSVGVFEPISSDFAAVQTYQVEGTSSIHVLLHVREITPHPREKNSAKT